VVVTVGFWILSIDSINVIDMVSWMYILELECLKYLLLGEGGGGRGRGRGGYVTQV
jgi:hypothetical protein